MASSALAHGPLVLLEHAHMWYSLVCSVQFSGSQQCRLPLFLCEVVSGVTHTMLTRSRSRAPSAPPVNFSFALPTVIVMSISTMVNLTTSVTSVPPMDHSMTNITSMIMAPVPSLSPALSSGTMLRASLERSSQ